MSQMNKFKFPRIGKLVREARQKTKWSQTDVSGMLGWKNGQFMSNIERGLCSVPSKYIPAMCELLKLSTNDVIEAMIDDYREQLQNDVISEIAKPEEGEVTFKGIPIWGSPIETSPDAVIIDTKNVRRFWPVPLVEAEGV